MISLQNPDFSQLISAIQSVAQGYSDLQKFSSNKLQTALADSVAAIQGTSGDSRENAHFSFRMKTLFEQNQLSRPALGASLIYGSRSSPLLRLIPVLHALNNRCSVIFLCSSSMHATYEKLFSQMIEKGVPEKSLALISTQDSELLETLITHPSLKAIHFNSHFYEGAFLKTLPLPLFKKRIRIHLGGRNPVIFTHDAPREAIEELLVRALDTTYLAEHSFNRWFVQDKNYSEFVKHVEDLLPSILSKKAETDSQYDRAVQRQNESLFKEKNWKSGGVNLNPDFNNCSPWQQQEVLGSLLTITRFKNTGEAVKFANTTNYASGAAVFSASIDKSMEIAKQLIMPHHFSQIVPDMGALPLISGLSETGFGQNIADKDFFVF